MPSCVHAADTAMKGPELVLATTMPCDTKNPPLEANEPVLTSSIKSTPAGAGAGDGVVELSLEQVEANPAMQAGTNTAAAPNPTLEKNLSYSY
ncbi:hypothetical protein ACFX5F_10440 [Flavobacterium sp. ZS1P70]|uniref:Uncharacterized protein n=1 Tax=Flavobacterium zhoui TaxID=3230414 RepID=A0ABW6I5T8_9FLAO